MQNTSNPGNKRFNLIVCTSALSGNDALKTISAKNVQYMWYVSRNTAQAHTAAHVAGRGNRIDLINMLFENAAFVSETKLVVELHAPVSSVNWSSTNQVTVCVTKLARVGAL